MRDLKWNILASEQLFDDLWFKVRKDTCEAPDGRIITPYYVYEFPTWVTALALTEDGQVILERQYRHALGEVCIEIPGGCVDPTDHSLEDAIARELLEETGYTFTSYEYLGKTSANPSTNNNLMHMFLARGGKKMASQNLDANEDIDVELTSIDQLKQMLRENRIMQAMHITCLLHGLNRLGELSY